MSDQISALTSRRQGKSILGDLTRDYCRQFGELERSETKDGMQKEWYRMMDGSVYLLVRAQSTGGSGK